MDDLYANEVDEKTTSGAGVKGRPLKRRGIFPAFGEPASDPCSPVSLFFPSPVSLFSPSPVLTACAVLCHPVYGRVRSFTPNSGPDRKPEMTSGRDVTPSPFAFPSSGLRPSGLVFPPTSRHFFCLFLVFVFVVSFGSPLSVSELARYLSLSRSLPDFSEDEATKLVQTFLFLFFRR